VKKDGGGGAGEMDMDMEGRAGAATMHSSPTDLFALLGCFLATPDDAEHDAAQCDSEDCSTKHCNHHHVVRLGLCGHGGADSCTRATTVDALLVPIAHTVCAAGQGAGQESAPASGTSDVGEVQRYVRC
jgi:hypothetical protein